MQQEAGKKHGGLWEFGENRGSEEVLLPSCGIGSDVLRLDDSGRGDQHVSALLLLCRYKPHTNAHVLCILVDNPGLR